MRVPRLPTGRGTHGFKHEGVRIAADAASRNDVAPSIVGHNGFHVVPKSRRMRYSVRSAVAGS